MRYIFLLLCIVTSAQALAIGAISGHVIQVRVDEQGQGMVVFDTQVSGTPPSCDIAYYANALAFDANTAGGRAVLAMALTAKTTNAVVTAYGTGVCGIYGGYLEDWAYGVIQ